MIMSQYTTLAPRIYPLFADLMRIFYFITLVHKYDCNLIRHEGLEVAEFRGSVGAKVLQILRATGLSGILITLDGNVQETGRNIEECFAEKFYDKDISISNCAFGKEMILPSDQ